MLHAIRFCWTLSVLATVVAVAYFFLNGTGTGARMALHSTLESQVGADWTVWLDYEGPYSEGEGYSASLNPLEQRLDSEPPSAWNPKIADWWKEATQNTDKLPLSIMNGEVRLGGGNSGIPDHTYGLALGVPPSKFAVGCGVLIAILLLIAAVLGKQVDAKSKEQQYHRPGSIVDPQRRAAR